MIQSKKRWFLLSIRLLGSFLCIFYCFREFIDLEINHTNFKGILILGFIGFMGISNLVLLLNSYEIEVSDKVIIKKYIFGFYTVKTLRERILKYAEFDFSSEYLYSKSLFLIGDKLNIEISSTEISNYDEIKEELIKGLNEDKILKKGYEKYIRVIGLSFLIFSLILILWIIF